MGERLRRVPLHDPSRSARIRGSVTPAGRENEMNTRTIAIAALVIAVVLLLVLLL